MPRARSDRYDLAEARDLGQRGEAVKHAVRAGNIELDTVAVINPLFRPLAAIKPGAAPAAERIIATVNRRVDILEYELAHKRISDAAFLAGRMLQALFERAGLSGGSTWRDGSRVDAEVAKELAIIRRIADARLIKERLDDVRATLGQIDVAIVRQVLGDNLTYAQVAQTLDLQSAAARDGINDWLPLGSGGQRKPSRAEVRRGHIAYVAQRFRDALETLAREAGRRRKR